MRRSLPAVLNASVNAPANSSARRWERGRGSDPEAPLWQLASSLHGSVGTTPSAHYSNCTTCFKAVCMPAGCMALWWRKAFAHIASGNSTARKGFARLCTRLPLWSWACARSYAHWHVRTTLWCMHMTSPAVARAGPSICVLTNMHSACRLSLQAHERSHLRRSAFQTCWAKRFCCV